MFDKPQIKGCSDTNRMIKEIEILKSVKHPHVIQLYEIIETETQIYLIMEYASKGELFNYIVTKEKLSEDEACKFFHQLISGIEYLHSIGIAHRDIKPENLLLDDNCDIKISDFGLSNTYHHDEKLKTKCGTASYTAPEVILRQSYSGLKVDIWSAGITLYTMVCGYNPFDDINKIMLERKIIKGAYELPDFASSKLEKLLKGMLEVNPDKRFNLEDIVQSEWFQLWKPENEPIGIIIGVDDIPIDESVLKQMTRYGFNTAHILNMIDKNVHNSATTIYYLLVQKKQRQKYIQNETSLLDSASILAKLEFQKPIAFINTIKSSLKYIM